MSKCHIVGNLMSPLNFSLFSGIVCWYFSLCSQVITKQCSRTETTSSLHLGKDFVSRYCKYISLKTESTLIRGNTCADPEGGQGPDPPGKSQTYRVS